MKKNVLVLALALPFLFQSCSKNDDYPNDYWQAIATVENPDNQASFTFVRDNGLRFWTAESRLPHNYRPKDGQRIIANYTVLSDKPKGSAYNHDVRINSLYEVLTKGIFPITPQTQDSIGNEPINILDIWLRRDYLNVDFTFYSYNKTHFINLVSDASKTYSDGKIHLEFRHNSNKDYPSYLRRGIVSFDLRSLQKSESDSVRLVIHTKEYNMTKEKTYDFTYKYGKLLKVEELSVPVGIYENLERVQ